MSPIRLVSLLLAVALTSGCAAPRASTPADPLESFNRGVYEFNDVLDTAVARPVAQGYDSVMPLTGKIMMGNFFSNLDDVLVTINDLLQGKFQQGFSDGMRVLVNTTVGAGGLIDVASMRLDKHNEDFGQTLGYWGMGPGPFLVLPVLGPSTMRDGVGLLVDSQPSVLRQVYPIRARNQLYLVKTVNRRAELLEQEKLLDDIVIDRYAYIRDAYLLRRQNLVYDGNPPHDAADDYYEDETPAATPPSPVPRREEPPIVPKTSSTVQSPRRDAQAPSVVKVWVSHRGM